MLMKSLGAAAVVVCSLGLLSLPPVHAASPQATIVKALSCEAPVGTFGEVQKALKQLGARPNQEGDYVLKTPIKVFGLPVTRVSLNDDDVEIFISVFPNASAGAIAAAARLSEVGGSYARETRHGTLMANPIDRQDVNLSCTVTQ